MLCTYFSVRGFGKQVLFSDNKWMTDTPLDPTSQPYLFQIEKALKTSRLLYKDDIDVIVFVE